MATDTQTDWAEAIGKPAFDAIEEMVKAIDCDFDRLEELRDERDEWIDDDTPGEWQAASPEDAEELTKLEAARGDCEDEDDAHQRINEDPLSLEVGGWWSPGADPEPTEYRILLGTGGPAVRIVGELGEHGEAISAWLEVQDWWKPWTEYPCDQDVLLQYASCFCLGD